MEWRLRLSTAGQFAAYFTGLEIRGFAKTIFEYCPTSCAHGPDNNIQLDDAAAYKPQTRIMHEMGHIAVYVSQPWTFAFASYGKNDPGFTWDYQTDEYASAGFEEAFASFAADSTLYNGNAVAPYGGATEDIGYLQLETSDRSTGCAAAEASWPLSAERYLWDVYDNRNDGEAISEYDSNLWWRIYRNYQHYAGGTGAYAADEHWNSTYTALDWPDGRGSYSYQQNYNLTYSFDTYTARWLNCSPL
jgi:hypothetical protein